MNKASNQRKNYLFRVYGANVVHNSQGETVQAIVKAFKVWFGWFYWGFVD